MGSANTGTPVKIVIVGHVDHGKSTLVGRLFHDTGSLPEGKLEAMQATCERRGVPFEWAFLMDALQAERDQNITIDTSQIWFDTDKRLYTIIDAPGHKEFLKNMITGAASANAALLLIAANEGIQEQSRRHCHMLGMLGINQVAVVVNKMDLVNYDQAAFDAIEAQYREFLDTIGVQPQSFIPISAREGDNIAAKSDRTPWYTGPTIVEQLDSFPTPDVDVDRPLRFPIQDIYRFDERRILAGRVDAGRIEVGQKLVFTPHNKTARVASIQRWSAPHRDFAVAGESIGITLDEQIFVERGHVASHEDNAPTETLSFQANVFWMGANNLVIGQPYKLKLASQEVECVVTEASRIIDGSTLEVISTTRDYVERYDVAEVTIKPRRPIALDRHDETPWLGRFVLVDGFDVAGGGIVLDVQGRHHKNLVWSEGKIARTDREHLHGHRGVCVWLTGLSGAGKSSIAVELEAQLHHRGVHTYILDGDNIRHGLGADLTFSADDRDEHIRRVGEVSKLFVDAGVVVISAFISPYVQTRDNVRNSLEAGQFVEVHVATPLEVCESRDTKGLYAKARAGEIPNFTGIGSPYEAPTNPELSIDTVGDLSAAQSARRVVDYLEQQGYLSIHVRRHTAMV